MEDNSDMDLPLTLSQENELIRNLYDEPNNFGSDFEGIGLLGSDEESINMAPFINTMATHEPNKLQPIKEEVAFVHTDTLDEYELDKHLPKEDEPEPPISHYISMATCPLPSREVYAGTFKFELDGGSLNSTTSCLFSKKLNKIFITLGSKCPIKFRCSGTAGLPLFLRAVPLFTSPQYIQSSVVRCPHHVATCKNIYAESYKDHVIRATHVGARYENDVDSKRLSVIIPFDQVQPGSDMVTAMYSFHCKNSCIGGMARKATEVIFTLENSFGIVLGRASMLFRVCSCPKRDLDKEEKDKARADRERGVKRVPSDEVVHSGKRRMKVILSDDKSRLMTKADGEDFLYVPVTASMAPNMVTTGLGLLLVKNNTPGLSLTPQEQDLKKIYEEVLSSKGD